MARIDDGDGVVPEGLPDGVILVRTTDTFTPDTTPAGLRKAHRVADGVWGRLVVLEGTVVFVFEDQPDQRIDADPTHPVTIPPARMHHVEPCDGSRFHVEFYR